MAHLNRLGMRRKTVQAAARYGYLFGA